MREVLGVLVGVVAAALLAKTWLVEGLFVPVVVHGGSMAPTLLGAHRAWQCRKCAQPFACNLESLPDDGPLAICPNCGVRNAVQAGAERPGERLLVDRSAFAWREPRRHEIVVVRSPDDPALLLVKRVVGLPGETIELAVGDVLIDGKPSRKSLAQLRSVAVPVCPADDADRWQDGASRWRRAAGWFVHETHGDVATDWLEYHHREPTALAAAAGVQPVLDGSAVDQNESRRLNRVDDLLLCCEVAADRNAQIRLRAPWRQQRFEATLAAGTGRIELVRNGRPVDAAQVAPLEPERAVTLEFAVADGRAQLAVAGHLAVQYDFDPSAASAGEPARWAIGAAGGRAKVRNLRLWRDVYYTEPAGSRERQYRLAEGEYFLLGDNSAHSRDGRHWPGGGVSGRFLVGPAGAW